MTPFSERITMPWRLCILHALFPAIVAWMPLYAGWIITGGNADSTAGKAGLFLLAWAVMVPVVAHTRSVSLSLANRLTWRGHREPVLRVRGTRRGETAWIPLSDVTAIEKVRLGPGQERPAASQGDSPKSIRHPEKRWWAAFFSFGPDEPDPVATLSVPGYSGPGLKVTYEAATMVSGGVRQTWRVQFPTGRQDDLSSLLQKRD